MDKFHESENMDQQKLWELLGKKLAGEASTSELEEIDRLLVKFPEVKQSFDQLVHYWTTEGERVQFEKREAALNRHLQRMSMEVPEEEIIPRAKGKRYWYRIAAAASLLMAVILGWYMVQRDMPDAAADDDLVTLTASRGKKNQFMLPDGSRVWLNSGTTITYPKDFDKDTIRRVTLSGEAFFEIIHIDLHPFLIETQHIDILDLGTSFNVKAYPQDAVVEATLIEGAIELKLKNKADLATLTRPHQKISVYPHTNTISTLGNSGSRVTVPKHAPQVPEFHITDLKPVVADTLLAEMAWLKDILIFRNLRFDELALEMERWYDVEIIFANEDHRHHKFTGSFASESLEEALEVLQLIKPFEFTIQEKRIIIQ